MEKTLQAALVALMLVPTGALAQILNKGRVAFNSGDYATALKEWTPLAEQDDAPAHNPSVGEQYASCTIKLLDALREKFN